MKRLYCDDFKTDAECCHSCHYEWEDGYGDPTDLEKEVEGYSVCVCCAKTNLIDKSTFHDLVLYESLNRP